MTKTNPIAKSLWRIRGNDETWDPRKIWQYAKSHPKDPIHKRFDWDVQRAAESHWDEVARQLIRLHIVTERGERTTISLHIDRAPGSGSYRDVDDVMSAPSGRELMLREALVDLRRIRMKYGVHIGKELAGVFREIDKIEKAFPVKSSKRGAA